LKSQQILESEIFAGEKKMSELTLQMVLGIREGMGRCVLSMGKKMGRVPGLEIAEKYEFQKSVKIFWTFLEAKNRLNGAPRSSQKLDIG